MMAKLFDEPKVMVRQLRLLRNYIELLFAVEQPTTARPSGGNKQDERGGKPHRTRLATVGRK